MLKFLLTLVFNRTTAIRQHLFLSTVVLFVWSTSSLANPVNGIGQWYLEKGNTNTVGRYQIRGDRQGKVTVIDIDSEAVVRTFQMNPNLIVRETFILDNGRTVAASQADHTVFWDLATGREIARTGQPVYGFNHNQTQFFTHSRREGIVLYEYPGFRRICRFLPQISSGPSAFQFSPNNRLLAIFFKSNLPGGENSYPYPNYTHRAAAYVRLFNLQTCQDIPEFKKLGSNNLFGRFTPDSRFYEAQNAWPDGNYGRLTSGAWRINLTTFELEQIPDFDLNDPYLY